MPAPGFSRGEVELTLRICMLLESIRAMHEARNPNGVREVLANHVSAVIGDIIAADHAGVLLEEQFGESVHPDLQLLLKATEERSALLETSTRNSTIVAPMLVRSGVAGVVFSERLNPSKPFDDSDLLILTALSQIASVALENAFQTEWLQSEVARLERTLNGDEEMVGNSAKITELRAKIARVAPQNTTVLITGESGTGKELVARALHRQSPRATKPFIAINCAALTETLLESELFGHEKGAFTGADREKRGRLEAGEGGTIFLDEIGDMPINIQAKMLRVLQNREFQRVGGNRTIPLDVRVIAATNRDLKEAVKRKLFREDLFYRLHVFTVKTPPLRERPEDIVPLAHHFLGRFAEKCGRRVSGISPQARALLRTYDWPGNIRELENAIEQAVVLGSTDTILPEDLPDSVREKWAETGPDDMNMLQRAIHSAKCDVVRRAFELANKDHADAAKLLGVHPNYLYRLLHNLNLSLSD